MAKYSIKFFSVLILSFLVFPSLVFAAVFYTFTPPNYSVTASNPTAPVNNIFVETSEVEGETVASLVTKMTTGNTSTTLYVDRICFTSQTFAVNTSFSCDSEITGTDSSSNAVTIPDSPTPSDISFSWSTGIDIPTGSGYPWVYFEIRSSAGNGSAKFVGSSCGSVPYTDIFSQYVTNAGCGTKPLLILGNDVSDTTTIVEVFSPLAVTTASTTVNFNFSYNAVVTASSGPFTIGGFYQDTASYDQISLPTQIVYSSDFGEYDQDVVLEAGHSYTWTPYLLSTTTGQYITSGTYGPFQVFFSASTTPNFDFDLASTTDSYLENGCSAIVGSSSGFLFETCYVGGYLFVPSNDAVNQFLALPSMLFTRVPFSFFSQIQSIVTLDSTEITDLPVLEIDLTDTAIPIEVTMFSSSTLTAMVGSAASGLRQITGFILWIGAIWYVYHRVIKLLHHKS